MTVPVRYEDHIAYAGYVNSLNLLWELYVAYKYTVCKSERFVLMHCSTYHMYLSSALGGKARIDIVGV